MNRWVLLEHKVFLNNFIDIHYDFLVESENYCFTWKLIEIPSSNKGFIKIEKQPNHRLVWLSRLEYELSDNRGFVKRIDQGNFINIFSKKDFQEITLSLDGHLLNGLFSISGDFCRLTNNN